MTRLQSTTGKYVVHRTEDGRLWLELEPQQDDLASLVGGRRLGLTLPEGAGVADAHELAFFLNKRGVGIALADG